MDELREAFEAAFDEAEKEGGSNIEAEEPKEALKPEPTEEPSEEPKEEPKEEEPKEEPKEPPADPKALEELAAKPAKTNVPASWGAGAKETWGKVPEAAQKEILKREVEVNNALKQSAGARRAVETLNRTMEPYKQSLIAAGVQDPFQAIDTLFRTEATLRNGTAIEKSQMIARMINQYSVDLQTLDSILAGNQVDPETSKFEQMLNEKLAPVNQLLSQQSQFAQQQQYEMQTNAAQSIEQFSQQAEFLSDVRNDMADLLDMAAARGQEMSLQEAYDKACALHPEVSKVLASRQKEAQIMGTSQDAQKKKAAAASLTGKQGGSGGGSPNLGIRDQIAQAWDDAMQG